MFNKLGKNKDVLIFIWVAVLVFAAGYSNSVSILYCSIPITHFTGHLTNFGINLFSMNIFNLFIIGLAVLSFFMGGVFSGAFLYKKEIMNSRRYGFLLIFCGVFYIIINSVFLKNELLICSTGFVSGVQNGLLVRYKNLTTRTTHMTGYLTDCSTNLGKALRGDREALKLFIFFLINLIIFILGAVFGAFCIDLILYRAFFISGALVISAGVFYLIMINKK